MHEQNLKKNHFFLSHSQKVNVTIVENKIYAKYVCQNFVYPDNYIGNIGESLFDISCMSTKKKNKHLSLSTD